jgi:iron complex transport system ATP-binding protein
MSEAQTILRCAQISFAYRRSPVLDQIDLSLMPGEVVSILGPNGSGKSTLLKLLLGELRGKGQIIWQDKALGKWARRELAKLVAYLPQNPLIEETQCAAEVLAMGRAPYWGAFGIENEKDVVAIEAVIEKLQIDRTWLTRRMDQLSGGQRQRILIGRCLVQQAKVLLLDEPTNNLDVKYQLQILSLLRELAKNEGLAVLMSGHDVNLAAEFSDRLVMLSEGKKVADGPPMQILQAELLEKVYGIAMEVITRNGGGLVVVPRHGSTTLATG